MSLVLHNYCILIYFFTLLLIFQVISRTTREIGVREIGHENSSNSKRIVKKSETLNAALMNFSCEVSRQLQNFHSNF